MPDFTEAALTPEGHEAKHATRLRTWRILQHANFLYNHEKNALDCGWLELAGHGAPTLAFLQQEHAFHPEVPAGHFYGVDRDPAVIADVVKRYAGEPRASWFEGDLDPFIMPEGAFADVGVLCVDSFAKPNGRDTFEVMFPRLVAFALRQKAELGEFLLVLNVVKRGVNAGAQAKYRGMLEDAFGVPFLPEKFETYQSKSAWMYWTAIRLGF